MALASLISLPFAFIGDYFESQLKRDKSIKDSGSLIPGHGGIWDRLDSHIAVVPIFILLLIYAMKNIVLLGATGSIGDSCLNVIRQNKEDFHLLGIGLDSNLDKAHKVAKEFRPEHIFVAQSDLDKSHDLLHSYPNILRLEDELQG